TAVDQHVGNWKVANLRIERDDAAALEKRPRAGRRLLGSLRPVSGGAHGSNRRCAGRDEIATGEHRHVRPRYASCVFLVLALVSAACYGAADFLGGFTSKRADTLAVVVLSQFTGLMVLAFMLPFAPTAIVTRTDLLWGAASGITGGAG